MPQPQPSLLSSVLVGRQSLKRLRLDKRSEIRHLLNHYHQNHEQMTYNYYQRRLLLAVVPSVIDFHRIANRQNDMTTSTTTTITTTTTYHHNHHRLPNSRYIKPWINNNNNNKWKQSHRSSSSSSSSSSFPSDNNNMTIAPHATNRAVNEILQRINEHLHPSSTTTTTITPPSSSSPRRRRRLLTMTEAKNSIFAHSHVDMGRIDTIGFDFDYTLVTYKQDFLQLIYRMVLERLVYGKKGYPREMLEDEGVMRFDPSFFIRGLAIDRHNGWITHLTHDHRVAAAWDGSYTSRIPHALLKQTYRATSHAERRRRLRPANDLFTMVNCALVSHVCRFLLTGGDGDGDGDWRREDVVRDVLECVGETHGSGDFHRVVVKDPGRYFRDDGGKLKGVLEGLKRGGKRLMLVSNSPFWYVNAGMSHVVSPSWRELFSPIIVSAGKPHFYTSQDRPFKIVDPTTGTVCPHATALFTSTTTTTTTTTTTSDYNDLIYAEGCLSHLTKHLIPSSDVLYVGDSLFADLVDAKRDYGWTTGCVTPEVVDEIHVRSQPSYQMAEERIEWLRHAVGQLQSVMRLSSSSLRGNDDKQERQQQQQQQCREDCRVLDDVEEIMARLRDGQNELYGNPFGSVFRARWKKSFFAHSLKRYTDLFMSGVECFGNYSPWHRFYPEDEWFMTTEGEEEEEYVE